MKATALVAAAGRGTRVGANQNKVLLHLLDVPVIVWTLRALEQAPVIQNVVLITRLEEADEFVNLVKQHDLTKVSDFVPGGDERQGSVCNGLTQAKQLNDLVVIHDAARPLASPLLFTLVCTAAAEHGAALAAIPVTDTLTRADDELRALETVPRESLWRVQTPQAFQRDVIVTAHRRARSENFCATDDATLVRRYGGEVRIVPGEAWNLKITEREDFQLAEALLNFKSR